MPRFESWYRRRADAKSDTTGTTTVPKRPMGRYVLALMLIGVLAALSTLVTHQAFSAKAQDATVLEYGLRQGYLAARVAELSTLAVGGLSQPLSTELDESVEETGRNVAEQREPGLVLEPVHEGFRVEEADRGDGPHLRSRRRQPRGSWGMLPRRLRR